MCHAKRAPHKRPAVGEHRKRSSPVERAERRHKNAPEGWHGWVAPRSESGPTSREAIPLPAEASSYHPRGLLTAHEPVVADGTTESARADAERRTPWSEDPKTRAVDARRAEFRRPRTRSYPFASIRFHVLLNSLFKVLFNFPSRYLFAIGLGVVFSLTRSLPRTLGCTPKQPDSREKSAETDGRLTGLSPSMGSGHCQVGL